MNSLEQYLVAFGLDVEDAEAMNRLQKWGIVSDECVFAGDVAEADCRPAIEFLSL